MEMQRWPSSLSSQNVGLRGVKREGELLSDSDSCITQYVNTAGFAGHYTLDISPGLVVLISLPFPFCESFKSLELPCTLDTLPVHNCGGFYRSMCNNVCLFCLFPQSLNVWTIGQSVLNTVRYRSKMVLMHFQLWLFCRREKC